MVYWYARAFLHLHNVPTELVIGNISREELSAVQSLNLLHEQNMFVSIFPKHKFLMATDIVYNLDLY